jgi:radical SAM superfamily enzyme with C-terminal helix-hairpin-helix motif
MMNYTILDCYTDEPAGLGVPPFLGTYPRYIYGQFLLENKNVNYVTIDDLRFLKIYNKKDKKRKKTNIKIYNLTQKNIKKILNNTNVLIVISGVHVPGKYLSALPGSLYEVTNLIKDLNCKKILTGPAATEFGTRLEGGKFSEKFNTKIFDEIIPDLIYDYNKISKASIIGSEIINEIPYEIIAEIETSRGCAKKIPCSFCTEPLKNKLEFRKINDILNEVIALNNKGVKHFRLGKQSDFFSWENKDMKILLSSIRKKCKIKTLHIDNADPVNVTQEKVEIITKYCTEGNVAALGNETFDKQVIKANHLNSSPEIALKAIKIINKYGRKYGKKGMPFFLPGINILFGLKNESKKTHIENRKYLKKILDDDLLLRRINIRQVSIYKGTSLYNDCGNKFIKKNKKYYWRWRNEIRQKIDHEMLKKLIPKGHILKNVRTEIHDGNNTFARQFGTYPLIIGIKQKLPLKKYYDVKITGHMLRSVTGEIIKKIN